MASRVARLQLSLLPTQAILLSRPADIAYFTGFAFLVPSEREALLLVTQQSAHLLYASFSPLTKRRHITYHSGCYPQHLADVVVDIQKNEGITTVFIDEHTLVVTEYSSLSQLANLTLSPLDRKVIWQLRMYKDTQEQARIRHACKLTQEATTRVLKKLKVGMTELEVADMLETELKLYGVLPTAFPTIVAFNEHTALPHHQPTDHSLKKESPVLVDIGGSWQGYAADLTRTVWFGSHPEDQFLLLEDTVMSAYRAVLELLRSSFDAKKPKPVLAKELDHVARSLITKRGYGTYFIHTTGHGLGLEIHEQPSLSSISTTRISKGMTLTVEPGIYLENTYGYRYENTVLITAHGYEELTLR